LTALKHAVEEIVGAIDPKFLRHGDIHVTLTGGFGYHRISPRELLSPFLGKIVSVEGVVTKCSCVRPKVARTTHFCEATGYDASLCQRFLPLDSRFVAGTSSPGNTEMQRLRRGRQQAPCTQ